jgi:hypothetical protein
MPVNREASSEESEHVGLLFASHAAVASVGIQKREQMAQIVAIGDVIGQTKRRLIVRYDHQRRPSVHASHTRL